MIFDHISNADTYTSINNNLKMGLRYLKETNLRELELGLHLLGDTGI